MKNKNWNHLPEGKIQSPETEWESRSQGTIGASEGFRWWMAIWLVIMIVVFVWILGWGWGGSSKGWGGNRQFSVRPDVMAMQ